MTLPDTLSEPAVLILGAAVLIGLLWVTFGIPRRTPTSDTAQVIAAVQAERDTLRANHAVEVATLENRLADAQERAAQNMDATFRLKELERALEDANARIDDAENRAAENAARADALEVERDSLAERAQAADGLADQREQARREVVEQSGLISRLRGDLQDAMTKLARATGAGANDGGGIVAALTGERDAAREEVRRLTETVSSLRAEIEARTQAGGDRGTTPATLRLEADVDALNEREARLTATIREREETIAELRRALSTGETVDADDAIERLTNELEAAREREKNTQEKLSRVSQEADGLRNRISSLDNGEHDARSEVEKRDAILELRLQKIHELEGKLREQHAFLMRTQRRAEIAEDGLAALSVEAGASEESHAHLHTTAARGDAAEPSSPEATERIRELEGTIESLQADNARLGAEVDALRAAEDARSKVAADATRTGNVPADPSGLEDALTRVAALQAENQSLQEALASAQQAPPAQALAADEVTALKAELRTLAERFLDASGIPEVPPDAEPSLAERIRAFKAARRMERDQ